MARWKSRERIWGSTFTIVPDWMRRIPWLKLEEIESHLQRKRCVGVKLYPGYYELYPNDKSLYPIYKMTEEYGKVLSVHTGMVAGNGGHLKYCRPIHLDDIATDFPGLKIVMCHFGNPFYRRQRPY